MLSEVAPIFIHLKLTEACSPSNTAGQHSGGSPAAVDDPPQTCTTAGSSSNDSQGKKVAVIVGALRGEKGMRETRVE